MKTRAVVLIVLAMGSATAGADVPPYMTMPRINHTATRLPDGRVLVAGGYSMFGPPVTTAGAEIFRHDPAAFASTAPMVERRAVHTATLLMNGTVLVAGGHSFEKGLLVSAETYDPSAAAWTPAGTLRTARRNHRATPLPDGRVLVTGGEGPGFQRLRTVEIYDPGARTWTDGPPMTDARIEHTATVLGDGRVLVAGGSGSTSVEIFDPQTISWMTVASIPIALARGHSATRLADGRVLVTGGQQQNATAVFDPPSGVWRSGPSMNRGRQSPTATLLADGRVLVVGGYVDGPDSTAEIYVPSADAWTATMPMTDRRIWHEATPLEDGTVLVTGGYGGAGSVNAATSTTDVFDPITNRWRRVPLVSIDDRLVAENGAANAAFRVWLSLQTEQIVTVRYTTVDGSATAPEDYASKSGTLTFHGRTQHTIVVPIVGDAVAEGPQSFFVDLAEPTGAAALGRARAVGTIEDPPPAALVPMLRAYNRSTDYHFFTTDLSSKNFAVNVLGFQDESSPPPFYVSNVKLAGSVPLFRMYNPNLGRHFYTASSGSRDFLMGIGATYEKDEGFVYPLSTSPQPAGTAELYLLYNNNSGTHLFTADAAQKDGVLGLFPGVWVQHTSVGFVFTSP